MTPVAVSRLAVLARGLRARCPACGAGRVFVRAFTTAENCDVCGFVFERGPGHWVGGNEINLLVTYPTAVVALAVPAMLWGASWWAAAAGGVVAVAIGLLVHRPARGLFFAIDYLVEPHWTADDGGPGPGDDRDDGGSDGGSREPVPIPSAPWCAERPERIELPVPQPAPRPDAEPGPVPWPTAPVR